MIFCLYGILSTWYSVYMVFCLYGILSIIIVFCLYGILSIWYSVYNYGILTIGYSDYVVFYLIMFCCLLLQAWLDDHDRSFGHFIDGKWVKPEGRKTYQTKNPATGMCRSWRIWGRVGGFLINLLKFQKHSFIWHIIKLLLMSQILIVNGIVLCKGGSICSVGALRG